MFIEFQSLADIIGSESSCQVC